MYYYRDFFFINFYKHISCSDVDWWRKGKTNGDFAEGQISYWRYKEESLGRYLITFTDMFVRHEQVVKENFYREREWDSKVYG